MKIVATAVIALATATSAFANETRDPLQTARSFDACDGREVVSARWAADQGVNKLAVTCGDALQTSQTDPQISTQNNEGGGLGPVGIGAVGLGLVGLFAIGSGSSTPSTQ